MLEPFKSVKDIKLGHIIITTHGVEIDPPATRLTYSVLHMAGLTAGDFEITEIDNMLSIKVIEPAQTELMLLVVFAPKREGSALFFVDYHRLNAAKGRDLYLLPRIDDFVDCLGDAQFFSAQNDSSSYLRIEVDKYNRENIAFTLHHGV